MSCQIIELEVQRKRERLNGRTFRLGRPLGCHYTLRVKLRHEESTPSLGVCTGCHTSSIGHELKVCLSHTWQALCNGKTLRDDQTREDIATKPLRRGSRQAAGLGNLGHSRTWRVLEYSNSGDHAVRYPSHTATQLVVLALKSCPPGSPTATESETSATYGSQT